MLTSLYLKLSKKKFQKTFKPLGIGKRHSLIVSIPKTTHNVGNTITLLQGLIKFGSVNLLVPKPLEHFYKILPQRKFTILTYTYPLRLFSKEYTSLKQQLDGKQYQYLIDLNTPANIHLPYLTMIQKRICFYEEKAYPYYNILVKDGFAALKEFFSVSKPSKNIFTLSQKQQREILKKYNKKKPLLFINKQESPSWNGDSVVLGKEITEADKDAYSLLYVSDAYAGIHDDFYYVAQFLNKQILAK